MSQVVIAGFLPSTVVPPLTPRPGAVPTEVSSGNESVGPWCGGKRLVFPTNDLPLERLGISPSKEGKEMLPNQHFAILFATK